MPGLSSSGRRSTTIRMTAVLAANSLPSKTNAGEVLAPLGTSPAQLHLSRVYEFCARQRSGCAELRV